MMGRLIGTMLATSLLAAGLAACSTGVEEADRAIFVAACQNVTSGTGRDCGCAFDQLNEDRSNDFLNKAIDDLQAGRAPEAVVRAVARCAASSVGGG